MQALRDVSQRVATLTIAYIVNPPLGFRIMHDDEKEEDEKEEEEEEEERKEG